MFVDRVEVQLTAGKGGDGRVAWRREKFVPKGGPTGGNGGKGGSVIFEADEQVFCLQDYRYRKLLKAENGQQGGTNQCQGRQGKDLILKVPCGTLIIDTETGQILKDMTEPKERWEACRGGKGGLGNEFFKSPTNQAPNKWTPGKEGDFRKIKLELKLIADVGLVGFPNAGKSTLVHALSNVRVKIAPYPFTTLHPNLGMVQFEDYSRIFIADIPGIIEGAHDNKGLGFEFLRHIERTKLLIIVLDASGVDGRSPSDDYRVLCDELNSYNKDLLTRPVLVAMNKIDTEEASLFIPEFKNNYPDVPFFEISAANKEGLVPLKEAIHSSFLNLKA